MIQAGSDVSRSRGESMRIGILLIMLGLAAKGEVGEQRAWLVVGRNCGTKIDVSRAELWFPMVDGEPDRKHVVVKGIVVSEYDSHCGVYRVERVNGK